MYSNIVYLVFLSAVQFVNQGYGLVEASQKNFQDNDNPSRVPTSITLIPGDKSIQILWTPPSNKEQLAFCCIEYKPEYPISPITIPVNKDKSQYTIHGLHAQSEYLVRLFCFYGNGRGPATDWIRASTKSASCDYGMIRCHSGECIWRSGRCDRQYDCADKSDEMNCNYTCEIGQFKCNTEFSNCISERLVCDGTNDCSDNSDEQNCAMAQCDQGQFQCFDKRCIPNEWVCDGHRDCEEGEDEHWGNRNIIGADDKCEYTDRCKQCPANFPNGRVQYDCGVNTDCLCSFECDEGFKPHPYYVNSALGRGFVPMRLLCEDGLYKTGYEHIGLNISGLCIAPGANCQERIPHGTVPYRSWVHVNTGWLMEMKCDPGYRPQALAQEQAHTFSCIDNRWVFKTTMYDSRITADTVCVENTTTLQTCSRSIPNGNVPDNCMVDCRPVCNEGFHVVGAEKNEHRVVTCEAGKWVIPKELSPTKDYSLDAICFPDGGMRCSEQIPNGDFNSSVDSLTDNGLSIDWDEDYFELPSGRILDNNMRKPVNFKCHTGYRKHRGVPYIECVAGRLLTWQERFGADLSTLCIPVVH